MQQLRGDLVNRYSPISDLSTPLVGKIILRPCKLYSFQRVTSEFCDEWILQQLTREYCNDWQENFTTSNEWILKGVNFALSNAQKNECCKESCNEWVSLQTTDSHWKLCLQKSKSYMIKLHKLENRNKIWSWLLTQRPTEIRNQFTSISQ